MAPIAGQTCDICGERLPGLQRTAEFQTCSACQETRPSFTKATAYGAYESELRDLIHLLKYDRVLPAASVLGRMLAEAIQKLDFGSQSVLVVPVPLHASKRRQRRFNQSELIARAALKTLAVPSWHSWAAKLVRTFTTKDTKGHEGRTNTKGDEGRKPVFQLSTNLLVRQRMTLSQIGLTRPQRADNIRGAFRVVHPNKVAGRGILLVDDVLTTGTTASECTRVLRKAGAENVWVATVGRTLKESSAVLQVEPDFESVAQVS